MPSRPILFILGTRSEAVKTLPVIHALQESFPDIPVRVGATGQHSILLNQIIDADDIRLAWNLEAMTGRQVINKLMGRLISDLEGPVRRENPAMLVVAGDSASTVAASLSAHLGKHPVAHIEAGIRGTRPGLPYPEENFRRMISSIATWHFAPTDTARENLLREGVDDQNVFVTGDPALDFLNPSLKPQASSLIHLDDPELQGIDWQHPVALSTVVRRENHGDAGYNICNAYIELARSIENLQIIHVNHLNPHLCDTFWGVLKGKESIHITSPLPRELFLSLLGQVSFVITDSAGVQEEASYFGKPIVSLRAAPDSGRVLNRACIVEEAGNAIGNIVAAATKAMHTPKRESEIQGKASAPRIAAEIAKIYTNLKEELSACPLR